MVATEDSDKETSDEEYQTADWTYVKKAVGLINPNALWGEHAATRIDACVGVLQNVTSIFLMCPIFLFVPYFLICAHSSPYLCPFFLICALFFPFVPIFCLLSVIFCSVIPF